MASSQRFGWSDDGRPARLVDPQRQTAMAASTQHRTWTSAWARSDGIRCSGVGVGVAGQQGEPGRTPCEVFQTEGLPPSSGRTNLATIGWTRNTRLALAKMVTAKNGRRRRRAGGLGVRRGHGVSNRLDRQGRAMLQWSAARRLKRPFRPCFHLEIDNPRAAADRRGPGTIPADRHRRELHGRPGGRRDLRDPRPSDVFERGFVTYSNRAKQELLGVPGDLIADLGAVSEPVARMMAEGASKTPTPTWPWRSPAWPAPAAARRMKPVGTVHIATARTNQRLMHEEHFFEAGHPRGRPARRGAGRPADDAGPARDRARRARQAEDPLAPRCRALRRRDLRPLLNAMIDAGTRPAPAVYARRRLELVVLAATPPLSR